MIATIITIARRWWPWIAVVALVTAVGWLIRDYGQNEYKRGQAEVQARWDSDKAAQAEAVRKQAKANAAAAHAASSQYQQEQAHDKQQTRIVREKVVQYVDRPVYRDRQCIDDGLRQQLNAAIAGRAAASR